jgi:hypothetical protein
VKTSDRSEELSDDRLEVETTEADRGRVWLELDESCSESDSMRFSVAGDTSILAGNEGKSCVA